MEKIHNNLNIDNLMRTDWINQFKPYQQKEIKDGYKKKLDISWYAKKEFKWKQMSTCAVDKKVDKSRKK